MFHRVRTGIQANASPGRAEELQVVEAGLRAMLEESAVFEKVEVEHTDDPDRLVIAMCTYVPFHSERDVARRLEAIWSDKLRYPFWEAHALHLEPDHVEFQAASRASQQGRYVTVHLVAQKGTFPLQRRVETAGRSEVPPH